MFALEVEYLMSKAYAGDFRDRGEAEWPPHPARLFSALASACFETEMGSEATAALQWLEQQPSPAISVPDSEECARYSGFVPTNYIDKNGIHTKQPRQFPATTLSDSPVYFIWHDAAPSPEIATALDSIAARVAYLGKSASFVRIRTTQQVPPATLVPSDTGDMVLRVPAIGRLEELQRLHDSGRWDPRAAQQRYGRVSVSDPKRHPSFFSDMIIFRRRTGYPLTNESTLTLTEALRNALMSLAGDDDTIPDLLHGHVPGPHCAFVALPFTSGTYADGRIMGCALLIPRERDPQQAKRVFEVAAALNQIALTGDLGKWIVELADEEPLPETLRAATWCKPARIWKSVTPVLLDQFPKAKLSVEMIITRSCERVGLPRPTAIETSPWSDVPGVPPVPQFRLLRSSSEKPRWGVHVTITFDEEIEGPLVLGAGRYFGLGLFRPAQRQS